MIKQIALGILFIFSAQSMLYANNHIRLQQNLSSHTKRYSIQQNRQSRITPSDTIHSKLLRMPAFTKTSNANWLMHLLSCTPATHSMHSKEVLILGLVLCCATIIATTQTTLTSMQEHDADYELACTQNTDLTTRTNTCYCKHYTNCKHFNNAPAFDSCFNPLFVQCMIRSSTLPLD